MRLSISNIGWSSTQDEIIYALMQEHGYSGLEIAPTRIFPEAPYDMIKDAESWAENLKNKYGFLVPSMQSIWYGRTEMIFGTDAEREILVAYTKKAIDFAAVIGCGNLVFGCPRNRNIPEGADSSVAIEFFREIGEYAKAHGTVIGMEANPPIYNTNYINDTASALRLIEEVACGGFKLNLDVGTMVYNNERVELLKGKVHLINHVHISEPRLKPIVCRDIHKELKDILLVEGYSGFISVEMGRTVHFEDLMIAMGLVKELF